MADARAAREFLAREGYRRDRIAVMGISLGGHVAALAHAVDAGFARGVFVLTGGDFADLLWNDSPLTRGIKRRLLARGVDLAALRASCATVEPLVHARPWRGAGVLLVAAARDRIVPPANVHALRTVLGGPSTLWIDATHVSGLTELPRIATWIADELDAGIGAEGVRGVVGDRIRTGR